MYFKCISQDDKMPPAFQIPDSLPSIRILKFHQTRHAGPGLEVAAPAQYSSHSSVNNLTGLTFEWPVCSLCFKLGLASERADSEPLTIGVQTGHHFVVSKAWREANIAHGVLMGIPVLVLFPAGGIYIRLSRSRHAFWVHVGCQAAGLVIALAGFATGVWTALIHKKLFLHPHSTWGTCIVAFWVSQPVSGWMHHRGYVRRGVSTYWIRMHRWLGRINMIMAMINLLVGLAFSRDSRAGTLAGCSVVTVVVAAVYLGVLIWWYSTRKVVLPREDSGSPAELIVVEAKEEQLYGRTG